MAGEFSEQKMITKLALEQKYQPKITGLGDIYEQISVERRRKILGQRFKKGTLFLVSNREHGGRGLSLEEAAEEALGEGYQILARGFVDSPPWPSKPRPKGTQSPFFKYPFLVFLSPFISRFLVAFEFFWQGPKRSHMVYVLGKKEI